MKISGLVIKGKGEGVTLGFPTANLKITSPLALENGVYAAVTTLQGKSYQSLAVRGMAGDLEVYLLGFVGDLYDQKLEVELGVKISDLIEAVSRDELVAKIEADIERAKAYFSQRG